MIIETERMYIRPWKIEDAQSYYELTKDPRIGPAAGFPTPKNPEEGKKIVQFLTTLWGFYALVLKDTSEVIGSIQILIGESSNFHIADDEGELGFWIGAPYWRKGFATEAIKEMIAFGFEDLQLKKIWCGYFSDNTASKELQQKCGFSKHHIMDKVQTLTGEEKVEIVTCITKSAD